MKPPIAIFLLIILLLAMGHHARAQSGISRWDLGVTAGMNISTHTDKYRYGGGVTLSPRKAAGYHFGLMVRRKLSESYGFQIEPSVIKLGARYNESFVDQGVGHWTESRTHLLYVQLPLKLQYSLDPFFEKLSAKSRGNNNYHITGGLWGGYLLDAHLKGRNYTSSSFEADSMDFFSRDVINNYSKYDAGVILGLGMEHNDRIGFDLCWQQTLLQAYKSNPSYKPKNRAFMFSVTYLLF